MRVTTVAEAGRTLGVSETAVRKLISRGRLTVTGRSGNLILLDEQQVLALADTGRRRDRPWRACTAWASLCRFSGERPDWLDPSTRARLRAKLRGYDVEDIRQLARHRATTLADPSTAVPFGLEAGPIAIIDGYTAPAPPTCWPTNVA
ncbi:hypothetical protein GCM10011512_12850 [Tersicoccus solisilvae]|uniref:Helix-turn-helix domain-containing protein n=1 Tax=Tersicoccus solisilvae TaxID=1882339 RepID=A0ABQ1P5T4_9MICC|nr:helix-turn-helix domain-containing protein [Tersicoccus solisilvae]GGC87341.1 hypothetical protein GCM10011512_12850 [Tersicoccus solisilvae]